MRVAVASAPVSERRRTLVVGVAQVRRDLSPTGRRRTSEVAASRPAYAVLDFGANAGCTVTWARLMRASGRPTNSTAGAGVRDHEGERVGQPDVLGRGDDQASGDEAGVLAGVEHRASQCRAASGSDPRID